MALASIPITIFGASREWLLAVRIRGRLSTRRRRSICIACCPEVEPDDHRLLPFFPHRRSCHSDGNYAQTPGTRALAPDRLAASCSYRLLRAWRAVHGGA